jgi:uncharacterized protein
MEKNRTYTAFAGPRLIVTGSLTDMILRTKECLDQGETAPVLIFDDDTGRQIDFDFRGTPEEALARLASHPEFAPAAAPSAPRVGPGRPKLGVVCREVSLLPRHWEWLEQQPPGISAVLRRLIDEARKREPEKDRARRARDAAAKFMWAMAGDLPWFEEASRALFAANDERLAELIRDWPEDIKKHLGRLLRESA